MSGRELRPPRAKRPCRCPGCDVEEPKLKKPLKKIFDVKELTRRASQAKRASQVRRREQNYLNKSHGNEKEKERKRWHERRAAGKIKLIKDMTESERREVRMRRLQSVKRHREKLKNGLVSREVQTTTTMPTNEQKETSTSNNQETLISKQDGRKASNKSAGRKKVKQNRSRLYRENLRLKKELDSVKRSNWRALKSKQKLKSAVAAGLSPKGRVKKRLRGKQVSPTIKKTLVFHEVLKDQLKESGNKISGKSKQVFYKTIAGNVIKKYRMLRDTQSFLSRKLLTKYSTRSSDGNDALIYERNQNDSSSSLKREETTNFFLRDDVSAKCPDKNAYVISYEDGKNKKRKRLLLGNMVDLYSKYKKSVDNPVSYTTFCRCRPFYVVSQKATERDTCLCKRCENFELKIEALHKYKIISENTSHKVLASITCDPKNDECLLRKCENCREKKVVFSEDVPNSTKIDYGEWVVVEKKNVKENQSSTKEAFQTEFPIYLEPYMAHCFRKSHQYHVLKEKRENLGEGELFIHFDFSENYGCKYTREIQSMYYGGNREEVTLHTGVLYTKDSTNAFCTLSPNGRHDPAAIWAHLLKILNHFMPKINGVSKIHMQSDSPVTQYRNKDYFYLATTLLPAKFPQITEISHNYTEAGHGKGGPDGVGGWAKRTADDAVACGTDISTFEKLVSHLQEKSVKTFIDTVTLTEIEEIQELLKGNLESFTGTMKVHQLTWKKESRFSVFFNEVSCFSCPVGSSCSHYSLPHSPWALPGAPQDSPQTMESNQFKKSGAQNQEIKKGDWVAVAFGKHWYPGLVEKTTAKALSVNFMVKHKKRNDLFLWPAKADVSEVKRSEVLMHFGAAPVPVDRCHFSIPEAHQMQGIRL